MQKIILTILIFIVSQTVVNSQVSQEWMQHFGAQAEGAYTVSGPLVDNNGNVFVSGTINSSTLTDYVTIKYNSSGIEQWKRFFSGRIEDRVIDMVLDNDGNVIVTGLSENLTGTYDIITIKYNTNGDSLWGKVYNGETAMTMDQPVAIAADENDNIYVSGYSFGSTPMTIVTLKYSSEGDSLWTAKFINNGTDTPKDIYVDADGNAYVYGRGVRLMKYNTNGNLLWNKIYSLEVSETNKSLTGDAAGNIYFTGVRHTQTFGDFAAAKLNSDGDTLWTQVRNGFGGSLTTHDDSRAICVDNSGNVFITGEIYEVTSSSSITTIKYNSSGVFQWEKDYTNPQNGAGGSDIVSDNSGNVYVTGGSDDFTTLKYNSNGDSLWAIKFNGSANMVDFSRGIAIDNSGHVYIAGISKFGTGSDNYELVTLKYTQVLTGISSHEITNKSFKLHQNYPNPFNPKTIINYDLSSGNRIKLAVYDVLGNEIAVLVNEKQNPGKHSVPFDGTGISSGVYYYKIEITDGESKYSDIKKMILLK